jgi:hypothetical protein
MVRYASRTANYYFRTDLYASRDRRLSADNAELTNACVVSDLHQVVDLGSSSDCSWAESATVDAGVCADFYI